MSYRPDLDADYPFRCDCICGCRDVKWKNGVNHGGKHLCSVCVIREGRGDCDHGTELCPSAQAWKDKFDAMTSGWIKITDDPKTLPKNDGLYLVMWGSDRAIFRYDTENQPCWVDISGNVYYSISGYDEDYEPEIRVTHWMPLPVPPAAEQTEE